MTFHDDFWLNPPKYPFDADGNPRYGPQNPAHPSWQRMTNWLDMGKWGEYLRSTQTKWAYVHPSNGKWWSLAGPGRGREGVILARELTGAMQPQFDIKYSEGPYMIGARQQRVDWDKRVINMGVAIQPAGNAERISNPNPMAYRMIESSWWSSWSESVPGFLGSFTRTHGWRWLKVVLGESIKTSVSTDPASNGNNSMQWDMTVHAEWPFYTKRPLTRTWKPGQDDIDANGVGHGIIQLANRGTWDSHPIFIVKGAGTATVQDGNGGKIVTLPKLYYTDGDYMMIDTDPSHRTIVTQKDPVDSQLYRYMRNSQLLDILLHDNIQSHTVAQRRIPGGIGFDNPIPPRTVAHLRVTHDNPEGSVTCIMPQNYRMAWS